MRTRRKRKLTRGGQLTAKPVALESAPLVVARVPNKGVDAGEVRKHNSRESAWVVIDSVVYDITEFLEAHVRATELRTRRSGTDGSVHSLEGRK